MIIDEVKTLVSHGVDIKYFQQYKDMYQKLTGKEYNSGCSGCAMKYLKCFFINYINHYEKQNN